MRDTRDTHYNMRMEKQLFDTFKAIAVKQQTSVADVIREALWKYAKEISGSESEGQGEIPAESGRDSSRALQEARTAP